jgi:hypothetical protein
MSINWTGIILDSQKPETAWMSIFSSMLDITKQHYSPVAMHDATVIPDRLLTEAAWELWESYPEAAVKTSAVLKEWTNQGSGKAVLILDALSLREMPMLLTAAATREIIPLDVKVTGSECPSTTDQFAKAIGLPTRSALTNNTKPGTFSLFGANCYTDVLSMPFSDCTVRPLPNIVIWHTWLDDLIHLQRKLPDQIANIASSTLKGDDFWNFLNRLRQGRNLVITSDHGYAVSKRFSSEVEDTDAVKILRETFGASRYKPILQPSQKNFMPPILMTHNKQHIVMGQRKWNVQGGFPDLCHGGMSLLEVAVPYIELPAL